MTLKRSPLIALLGLLAVTVTPQLAFGYGTLHTRN